MAVEFTDNTMKVKQQITTAVNSYLYEAGGELQSQIIRNSDNRTDTGQTKGSYSYKVMTENNVGTVYVGSDFENAIWEEFGTGEYALNGDGRKDVPWIYKDRKGNFYRTTGKKPNRPVYRAFTSLKDKLISRLQKVLGQL